MGFFDKLFGGKKGAPGLFPDSISDKEIKSPQMDITPQADLTMFQRNELSEEERILLAGLGISEETGLQLKDRTKQKIEGLFQPFWADSDKEPLLRGVKSIYLGKDWPIAQLNEEKSDADIHFFGCGGYASDKNSYIGVVKAADRYDLLRIMETNGANYDVDTEDIVDFLKKWEGAVSFLITKCEADTLIIKFDGENVHLPAMVAEAVELCPDLIADEVTPKTVDGLVRYVKETGEIYFWWD